MTTRILLTLSAILAATPIFVQGLSSQPQGAPLASERCYITQDTYVAGQRVAQGGHYCHPWI